MSFSGLTFKGSGSTVRGNRPEFVPGVLVVRIKEDVVANVPTGYRASAATMRNVRLPTAIEATLKSLAENKQIKDVVPVFAKPEFKTRQMAIGIARATEAFAASVRDSERGDLRGINLLRLSTSANLAKVQKDLVNAAGVNYVHQVAARWLVKNQKLAVGGDPKLNRQWGLRAIHWFEVMDFPDADRVKVALLDTGVDTTHPDLRGVVASYNNDGATAEDINGHGTHLAGIIAAKRRSEIGISGVCRCQLHVWKIFSDQAAPDGKYYVDPLMYYRSLAAARDAGARVVNLSIGGTRRDAVEEMLVRRAIDDGVVVVAAMGNEYLDGNPVEYPASFHGILAVGATDETNLRAHFSNTGRNIALSAPGRNILSTLPMKTSGVRPIEAGYAVWDGTSMAAAHVTAAAALVIARNPDFTANQVIQRLKATATKLRRMRGKRWTKQFGAGLLNLKAALA